MSREPNLLIVGGVRVLHEKVNELGIRYTLLMPTDNVKPKLFLNAEQILVLDYRNEEKLISLIKCIHAQDPFDGVVCIFEKQQPLSCKIAAELGLISTSFFASNITLNKHELRRLLNQKRISSVSYSVCKTDNDLKEFINDNGFPIIVKPVDGWASTNVIKINSFEQLNKFLEREINYPVLSEEFLEGKEISVETFTIENNHIIINLTEKILQKDSFVEIGHNVPYSVPDILYDEINCLIKEMLDLINHKFGPCHIELMLTNSGPKIIEVQTRPGGDAIHELIEIATEIDIIDLMLEFQTGRRDLSNIPTFIINQYASIRFFEANRGRVTSISGIEEIKKLPNVVKVELNLSVGDIINDFSNSFERFGYVIIKGENNLEIENTWLNIQKIINIQTKEDTISV